MKELKLISHINVDFQVIFKHRLWQGACAYFRIEKHNFSGLFITKHDDLSQLFNFSKKSYGLQEMTFFGKDEKNVLKRIKSSENVKSWKNKIVRQKSILLFQNKVMGFEYWHFFKLRKM